MGALAERQHREAHPEVAEREEELARLRAIEAGKAKRRLIEAKKVYLPIGRDAESGDIIASVFASDELWRHIDPGQQGGAVLEPEDVSALFWALIVLSENKGQPVEYHFQHRPRGRIARGASDERLKHLAANHWITYDGKSATRKIGLGSRVERLRKEFRETFIERAKEELKAERAARRKTKETTSS